MSDEEDNRQSHLPGPARETQLATSSNSQLPKMGGVVNRWLDHFRSLDNAARSNLVRSLMDRVNAEGELVDAYVSFERKKRQLVNLDAILDLEDEELLDGIAERRHQLELNRRRREQELNPPEAQAQRPHKRGPSREERLRAEAESIMEYGTVNQQGAIAEGVLAEYASEYGEDESTWPEEIRENARRLRLWKLKNA